MQEAQQDEDAVDPEPEPDSDARGSSEPAPPENPPLPGVAEPHAEPEAAVSPPPTLVASSSSGSMGSAGASPFVESQWRLEADGARSSGSSPKGGDHQVYVRTKLHNQC